uniref:Uncharacterized protein n=2 Tax=Helianthus annuus TaxID=4232 RepID=A0A251VMA0_HELAN
MTLNGETYESPKYYTTLQQAEHLATEVALDALANRGLSNTLATRILVRFSWFQLMPFLLVSLYYTFICIFTFVAIGSWLVLIYCLLLKNDVVLGTNICKTAIDHDILT